MVQDSTREDLFAHMENLMTQFTAKRGGRGESFKSKTFLVISKIFAVLTVVPTITVTIYSVDLADLNARNFKFVKTLAYVNLADTLM